MSNFFFKEIKKNSYILLNINNDSSMSKINMFGNNLYSPFGIESYKNKYILNLEITKKKDIDFWEDINKLDNFLRNINGFKINNNIINLKDLEYYPIIKKRKSKKPIIRTHIKITKNKINTKIKDTKNNLLTIFEFPKKSRIDINIEIGDLWIYKNTYGINIFCKNIDIKL
jgi:hypothetical protein